MMKRIIKRIFIIATLFLSNNLFSAQNGDEILGTYRVIGEETKKASNIKFYKKGNIYEAQIIWYEDMPKDKENTLVDKLNPDPKLRSVPVNKIVVIKNLRYDVKDNKWIGGEIYNPVTGKIYNAMAEFETSEKLKMRAYLGVISLGKNFVWTKIN